MADEKIKISELDAASQSEFTDGALLPLDVEDQNSSTGYSTKSGLLSRLIAYIKTKLGIEDLKNVNITTSDNNKLLGVSVSGSDISVGAVDSRGVLDYQTYTLTHNTVDYVFTKRGHIVSINFSKNSQTTFTTSWTSIGTLPSGLYYGTIFAGALIPDNHRLLFRVASDGEVSVMCDTTNNVWAQGSAIYMV